MEVIVRFELFGEKYEFRRNISDFDRNHKKEPYAYFNEFLHDERKTRFEITLLRTNSGELTKDYAYVIVFMADIYGKEQWEFTINKVDVEFRNTIDDEPKYLNPPMPDGIVDEIEYLKGRMSDTTKIPASRLPNSNYADENETPKPTPKWDEDWGNWIIWCMGMWLLIEFIICLYGIGDCLHLF